MLPCSNITFKVGLLKAEIYELLKQHKPHYQSHATDETAQEKIFDVY
jgi:hypothetical protein